MLTPSCCLTLDINDCQQNPCLNGGLCADGVNAFTCQCPQGFTGNTCQTSKCVPQGSSLGLCAWDCQPNPCLCTDGMNAFNCQCSQGFTGNTHKNSK